MIWLILLRKCLNNMFTIALVGRPNVGKSSLFNRILQKKIAVVDSQPGITRDRNYAVCDWNGINFNLIDTGGMVPNSEDLMEKMIFDQTEFALHEADLIIFIVDNQVGTDPIDRGIARKLNRAGKKLILVANKVDNETVERDIYDFMKLGLGEPLPVSATIGLGIGELLDRIIELLPEQIKSDGSDAEIIRVALAGRPNVGKSSFINALLGENRLIVTPIAGTTRDAVDTPFEHDGQKYILIDTAGLRRKYKIHENIEFYTSLRSNRAIENCDVALVMIDASDGITVQDQRILEQVFSVRRPALLLINKWDLVEKDSRTADEFSKEVVSVLAKYGHLPMIFISALTGQRVEKVLSLTKKIYHEARKRIPTPALNDFLQEVVSKKHPPAKQGKYIKFHYVTQSEVNPPTFIFFSNRPKMIAKSYISYLNNQIRDKFGFEGVPFRVKFRKK